MVHNKPQSKELFDRARGKGSIRANYMLLDGGSEINAAVLILPIPVYSERSVGLPPTERFLSFSAVCFAEQNKIQLFSE